MPVVTFRISSRSLHLVSANGHSLLYMTVELGKKKALQHQSDGNTEHLGHCPLVLCNWVSCLGVWNKIPFSGFLSHKQLWRIEMVSNLTKLTDNIWDSYLRIRFFSLFPKLLCVFLYKIHSLFWTYKLSVRWTDFPYLNMKSYHYLSTYKGKDDIICLSTRIFGCENGERGDAKRQKAMNFGEGEKLAVEMREF